MAKPNQGPGKPTPVRDMVQDCPHCRRSYKQSIIIKLVESEADDMGNVTCLSKGCGGVINVGPAPSYKLTPVRTPSKRLPRPSGRIDALSKSGEGQILYPDTVAIPKQAVQSDQTMAPGAAGGVPNHQQQLDACKDEVKAAVLRGEVFDNKYKAIRVVGEGATGIVVSATDLESTAIVALKFHVETRIDDDEGAIASTRALRALQVQALFDTPHVLRPLGSFTHPSFGLVTVERFIDGDPLIKRIEMHTRHAVITEDEMRTIARQLGSVLADAQERRVVHRDIKPHNVMCVERAHEQHAVLVDWGLARGEKSASGADVGGDALNAPSGQRNKWDFVVRLGLRGKHQPLTDSQILDLSASLTNKSLVLGTPYYMAPEHIKGAVADHRSDLYSLGATLYHLVTGQPPFLGRDPLDIMRNVLGTELELAWVVAERNGLTISKDFSRLLSKLLERDPESRYQSAKDFLEELKALPPVHIATTASRRIKAATKPVSRRLVWGLFFFLLASATILALSFSWPSIMKVVFNR